MAIIVLLPFQGEGWDGDGSQRCILTYVIECLTHPRPNPPLEGEGSDFDTQQDFMI